MSNSDILRDALNALAERVATLEAVLAKQATDPTYAHPAEIFGPNNDPSRVQSDLQWEAAAANKRKVDVTGPLASGQLASAGGAGVPPGWKPAFEWRVTYAPGAWFCDHVSHAGRRQTSAYVEERTGESSCTEHAVEMGALVKDEPPAEQPSRQETGGGETIAACCVGGLCPEHQPVTTANLIGKCKCVGRETCRVCLVACRDRAKAKAAEQAKKEELTTSFVEHMRPLMVTENGRALMTKPSEPSGNPGELECDCREIETTAGVDPTGGVCGCICHWRGNVDMRCPGCSGSIKRDEVWRHGFGRGRCSHAEPSGTGQLQSALVGCVKCRNGIDRQGRACRYCSWRTGPIAAPPAPAAGTLSTSISAAINALPEHVRRYVHDIEANCDPAGTVRDNVLLRDQLAAIEAKLAQAERERDEWQDLARKEKRNATDAARDLENAIAQAEARVIEATAEERARCEAYAVAYLNDEGLSADWIVEGIRSGKHVPGAAAQSNDVADNCARAAAAYAENMKDRPKET